MNDDLFSENREIEVAQGSILRPLLFFMSWYWAHSCAALPVCSMIFTVSNGTFANVVFRLSGCVLAFQNNFRIINFTHFITLTCTHRKKNKTKMCWPCFDKLTQYAFDYVLLTSFCGNKKIFPCCLSFCQDEKRKHIHIFTYRTPLKLIVLL